MDGVSMPLILLTLRNIMNSSKTYSIIMLKISLPAQDEIEDQVWLAYYVVCPIDNTG